MKTLKETINESQFKVVKGKELEEVMNSIVDEIKKHFKGNESVATKESIRSLMFDILNEKKIKWFGKDGFTKLIDETAEKLAKEYKKK